MPECCLPRLTAIAYRAALSATHYIQPSCFMQASHDLCQRYQLRNCSHPCYVPDVPLTPCLSYSLAVLVYANLAPKVHLMPRRIRSPPLPGTPCLHQLSSFRIAAGLWLRFFSRLFSSRS
eukprot:scaffold280983_cov71-Attheya_sp.AAC.3